MMDDELLLLSFSSSTRATYFKWNIMELHVSSTNYDSTEMGYYFQNLKNGMLVMKF